MLRVMTIDDYESLFAMWKNTPGIGLRSLDDSREGIARFLKRNPNASSTASIPLENQSGISDAQLQSCSKGLFGWAVPWVTPYPSKKKLSYYNIVKYL